MPCNLKLWHQKILSLVTLKGLQNENNTTDLNRVRCVDWHLEN